MVHTDALSSDFLGLPLPESIFCERPNFVPGLAAPDLCSQQGSMADLSQFLAGSQQPQLSLAQLSSMLGAAAPPGTADLLGAGSSGYLEQALADFQFGLGGAGVPRNADADPSLPELVDIPADNEFSVFLDSFASGNPGTDADSYSSIGADDMFDVAPALVTAPGRGARMLGGRVGGGGGGFDVGHGSSSTITIMNDSGQDSGVGTSARWVGPRPAPARPPPGPPGIARGRGGKTKRTTSGLLRAGPSARSTAAAKPAPIVLSLPSNPPSATGVGDLDIAQLIGSASQPLLLDWPVDGDSLERELEGLIDFDA
ncbi:hypothetical protein H4R21_001951 [Coemansia helicoidea]|uniref:Uncharacterized protein n=1 Tax=Coemansia helicoidea TaxID=1286919 RepID=A0ACC1LAJ6_9FUNG|nr:hypothetical protein H4R21_001951 [Coemansia helicoidea]